MKRRHIDRSRGLPKGNLVERADVESGCPAGRLLKWEVLRYSPTEQTK